MIKALTRKRIFFLVLDQELQTLFSRRLTSASGYYWVQREIEKLYESTSDKMATDYLDLKSQHLDTARNEKLQLLRDTFTRMVILVNSYGNLTHMVI